VIEHDAMKELRLIRLDGLLASSNSPRTSWRMRRFARTVLICGLAVALISLTSWRYKRDTITDYIRHAETNIWEGLSSQLEDEPLTYAPGQLGRSLLKRRANMTGGRKESQVDLFDMMRGRDESLCDGWTPDLAPEQDVTGLWEQCWRARIWKQADSFRILHDYK
jgi:hypothetical protein